MEWLRKLIIGVFCELAIFLFGWWCLMTFPDASPFIVLVSAILCLLTALIVWKWPKSEKVEPTKPNGNGAIETDNPHQEISPNISLTDLIKRSVGSLYKGEEGFTRFERILLEAARSGQILVWGRIQRQSEHFRKVKQPDFGIPEIEIPCEYWSQNKIAWITHDDTQRTDAAPGEKTYGKLRFNAKQLQDVGLIRDLNPEEKKSP